MKQKEYRKLLLRCVYDMLKRLDVLMKEIEYDWDERIELEHGSIRLGKEDGETFITFNGTKFTLKNVHSKNMADTVYESKYDYLIDNIEYAIEFWPVLKYKVAHEKNKWELAKNFKAD